jgi:hypothetical protein
MEIFGGFIVMLWMLGFFLTIIWFVLPFVVFNIKGRVEQTLLRIESIDSRLDVIEKSLSDLSTSHDNKLQ